MGSVAIYLVWEAVQVGHRRLRQVIFTKSPGTTVLSIFSFVQGIWPEDCPWNSNFSTAREAKDTWIGEREASPRPGTHVRLPLLLFRPMWQMLTYRIISSDLGLVTGKKFTLIGTPQGHEIIDPSRQLSTSFLSLLHELIFISHFFSSGQSSWRDQRFRLRFRR